MMMKITVWQLPNCVQCENTKRQLDKRGIVYEVRDLHRNPKAVERFKELDLISAPIIETDNKRWSGFRLDKINSLDIHLRTERMRGISVPLEPMTQIAEDTTDDE
jgi:glutaredoxin-like protein NrdH